MAPKPTAAAARPKLSTKRSRKSRTEIVESSSSSSSSSDSESSSSAASATTPKASKKQKTTVAAARDNTVSPPQPLLYPALPKGKGEVFNARKTEREKKEQTRIAVPELTRNPKAPSDSDDSASSSSALSSSADESELSVPPASAAASAFPSWYLRSVTQELAEDLDKVRGAPDFGDAALPLLVHALQQGEACFSPAEKARVMGGAAARD
ncbi:ribosome assembly protein 3 [Diplodia corticola]|uniref:Ribosome assembly protein 3 n=1 Tax=Diplodia corticola TaxID=236234 RepID=A0A1J9S6Y2_9PEZI|nr:ribosome assembly protein 3 [Diplodia corticola]OJD35684.1 ribosome assembly protein 3 [Diplodia corticola]